jgi:hypothetical protein
LLGGVALFGFEDGNEGPVEDDWFDPLIQGDGHDHHNASQHNFSTDNIDYVDYNSLTTPGNAEVQVVTAPDGRTYAYQAGWNEMHITDVTDPYNTVVVGRYYDPNTQVLDIKYLEYDGREYIILQNQLVDTNYADPNIGTWDDPMQVSVNLVDVTDKTDPQWVDSWYDTDHPSGPHNLFTHMIDGEWYIFVANPEYEACDIGTGEACGGITIAHLNFAGFQGLPRIVKLGEAEVAWETTRGGWIYIHDMTVQQWPGEDVNDPRHDRTFIYGAYWEAGLRIFDVSDVPHPVNSPENYLFFGSLCYATHNPVTCNWRAPEVGHWDDFADLDEDGELDSQTTGNVNGGRASYIHYVEPFPVMVDIEHVGAPAGKRHLTTLATEVLTTSHGTGLAYLLDTTAYTMNNGQFHFEPTLYSTWEVPNGENHCYGGDCPINPDPAEWLMFSPHNFDSVWFPTTSVDLPDNSHGGDWDGRLYMGNYHTGLWVLDIETLVARGITDHADGFVTEDERNATHRAAVVGYYVPHGSEEGEDQTQEYYDRGATPTVWTAEYHDGFIYISDLSGLYVVQLDIDVPYEGMILPLG